MMRQYQTIIEVRNFIQQCQIDHKTIGFVPTMGSLHQGHIGLVKKARENNDIVIVSIFVNKAQFNDIRDYELYPNNLEGDKNMLQEAGVDVVFTPNHTEIYPHDFSFQVIPNLMLDCLCAKFRKGHFQGVCTIVAKLFNIIQPHHAYFGEKDFQQLAIIKKMVKDLNFGVEIVACETIREDSGLAMSSRNQRLSKEGKIRASLIYKILNDIKLCPDLIEQKKQELLENGFEKIEYLEIREEENLELNDDKNCQKRKRIFIATYLEGVRLIDNLLISQI